MAGVADDALIFFAGLGVGMGLADLDQVRIAVEAECSAAGGCDVERGPGGFDEEGDGGLAYGLEASEAVGDVSGELGVGPFVGLCGGQIDLDFVALGDAGDV